MADVSTRSKIVEAMLAESKAANDIYLGGDHMRALSIYPNGTIRDNGQMTIISGTDRILPSYHGYLPKFPAEDQESYVARVCSSWLLNGVKKCVDDMKGKQFERPVEWDDEVSPEFNDILFNANMEGDDLNTVAMEGFTAAMRRGISFFLVDAPSREGTMSRAQVQAANIRPFVSVVTLEECLGWTWEIINNVPTLTSFRVMETAPKPDRDEWSDETVDQVRALTLEDGRVVVRLYQGGEGKGGFDVVSETVTDMTQIMVAPFYTDKVGYMKAKTPLYDLAEINLAWFRSNSDQANIMHHARAPMKFFAGFQPEEMQTLSEGAGYAFASTNPDAKVEVIEHGGSAIAAGREELKDLEFQMQVMGLQMVISKTGNNTATGDSIDEAKQNSQLSIWADNMKTALEKVVGWMAELVGNGIEAPELTVNTEYAAMNHLTMDQVRDMYNAGVISNRTYINEAKRRGVLDEAVNPDDEQEYMDDEGLGGIPNVSQGDEPPEDE